MVKFQIMRTILRGALVHQANYRNEGGITLRIQILRKKLVLFVSGM